MRKPASCGDGKLTMINKGAWSKQEDQKLIDYIHTHGEGGWRTLPQAAGLLRCGKSCRLRWANYLRPNLKRGSFGEDEEDLIIKLHALLGNSFEKVIQWSLIAGRLPGRTDNEVKNYWNSHLKRKLISMGLDPNSHRLHISHRNLMLHQAAISDASTSLSCKITNDCNLNHHFEKTHLQVNNDEVSDAASCLSGAENFADLPDLNLEFSV